MCAVRIMVRGMLNIKEIAGISVEKDQHEKKDVLGGLTGKACAAAIRTRNFTAIPWIWWQAGQTARDEGTSWSQALLITSNHRIYRSCVASLDGGLWDQFPIRGEMLLVVPGTCFSSASG